MRVAFDVDGTLIVKNSNGDDVPRYSVIQLLFLMKQFGCEIYVWSGGGFDYATRWCEKLGIEGLVHVCRKGEIVPDIAVDDMECKLGTLNIKV